MIAVRERRGIAFNDIMPYTDCFHPRNEKRWPATRACLRAARATYAAVAAAWLVVVAGCNESENRRPSGDGAHDRSESTAAVTIAKWFNNHSAAISITYDDWPDSSAAAASTTLRNCCRSWTPPSRRRPRSSLCTTTSAGPRAGGLTGGRTSKETFEPSPPATSGSPP